MNKQIDAVIAEVPEMKPAKRAEWRAKAERLRGDADAQRLLQALDAAEAAGGAEARRISTGRLSWEPHDPAATEFRGYDKDGRSVARIVKDATHTAARKDVYWVEVEGRPLPDRFARVENARNAGERAWTTCQEAVRKA